MSLRVTVHGAAGRMGQAIVRLIGESFDLSLAAAIDRALAAGDLEAALAATDVLIDFSSPEGAALALDRCAALGVRAVTGTTGLDDTRQAAVAAAARRVAVVQAPNMSAGVNVTYRLVAEARRTLGDAFAPAVFEAHHRHKKDAPSGTALALGREAGARADQVVAVRGGDVVGEHTVFFFGDGERVEITHRATSRDTFCHGALRAARWVAGRPPGLYTMADVLGLA
jgi:4-hydroxy-tetrahydrodipicolinate reductase